jgi:hypothetical protein
MFQVFQSGLLVYLQIVLISNNFEFEAILEKAGVHYYLMFN